MPTPFQFVDVSMEWNRSCHVCSPSAGAAAPGKYTRYTTRHANAMEWNLSRRVFHDLSWRDGMDCCCVTISAVQRGTM